MLYELLYIIYVDMKKSLKRMFPLTRPMRGVLGEGSRWGGPQRGGPSRWSWQMTLPPLHMLPSRPPHEEQGQRLGDKAFLYASNVERQWTWGLGCATNPRLPKEHYRHNRIGADPGDTKQRRETKRGASREPHDQHGVRAMLNTMARARKRKREHIR